MGACKAHRYQDVHAGATVGIYGLIRSCISITRSSESTHSTQDAYPAVSAFHNAGILRTNQTIRTVTTSINHRVFSTWYILLVTLY